MTTIIDTSLSAPAGPAGRSRRFKLTAVFIALVVLGAIGTGIGWIVYAHTYQPLSDNSGGLTSIDTPSTVRWNNQSDPVGPFRLIGPKGSTGTVVYDIWNEGSHSIKLLGLPPSDDPRPIVTAVHWSPGDYDNGQNEGQLSAARNFPVTVPPHADVLLQVTAQQLGSCNPHTQRIETAIPIRWSAFGVSHVWQMQLADPTDDEQAFETPNLPPEIEVCTSN
jgi:hypothetical protein